MMQWTRAKNGVCGATAKSGAPVGESRLAAAPRSGTLRPACPPRPHNLPPTCTHCPFVLLQVKFYCATVLPKFLVNILLFRKHHTTIAARRAIEKK